jgi:hypothetical protein
MNKKKKDWCDVSTHRENAKTANKLQKKKKKKKLGKRHGIDSPSQSSEDTNLLTF